MLKNLFRQKPSTFDYMVRQANSVASNNNKFSKFGASPASTLIKSSKSNDTIYLLGSGPSINTLSKKHFDEMEQNTTIGFNYWFLHEFIPDMYLFQVPPTPYSNDFLKNFVRLYDTKRKSKIIMRGTWPENNEKVMQESIEMVLQEWDTYYQNIIPIHSDTGTDIEEMIRFFSGLGCFNFNKMSDFSVKWRATITLLISIAYQAGFRNIVLCGIDMLDEKHFWDDSSYDDITKTFGMLPDPNRATGIRNMSSPNFGNSVPRYIKKIKEHAAKDDVRIYLGTKGSALEKELPQWLYECDKLSE